MKELIEIKFIIPKGLDAFTVIDILSKGLDESEYWTSIDKDGELLSRKFELLHIDSEDGYIAELEEREDVDSTRS